MFGPLFYSYQDISDSLIGIMMRAKKRKFISYPGDMLFQGYHDEVEITLETTALSSPHPAYHEEM
jgi:hypothetical protein